MKLPASAVALVVGLIAVAVFFFRGGDPMQKALQAYQNGSSTAPSFAIDYHIGNSFSGETSFQLRGDGSYELWSTVTKGRERKSYAGQIDRSRVSQLVDTMLTSQVWEAKHIRAKPRSDDPTASIAVTADGQQRVALWVSEIPDVPAFAVVQSELLNLIYEISNREVLELGR